MNDRNDKASAQHQQACLIIWYIKIKTEHESTV